MKLRYELSLAKVGGGCTKGYFCQRKNSQHIMYYPIIFFDIDILLLG